MDRFATFYPFPEDLTPDALLATLRHTFALRPDGTQRYTRHYLDTFDWRLYDAGLILSAEPVEGGFALSLWGLDTAEKLHTCHSPSLPGFADDVPEGALRATLAPILPPRVLIQRVKLRRRERRLRLLGKEEKTIGWVLLGEPGTAHDTPGTAHPLPGRIRIRPLKGYAKACVPFVRFLRDELGLAPSERPEFLRALEAIGQAPGAYSSKYRFVIDPEERADLAARRILRQCFATMQLNEPGLRADLDPEFVHDYRVAVRRTRSVLGQLKHLFLPEPLVHFRAEFKWLGAITGPTRDLDVYLLGMDDYRAALPPHTRADLAPLAAFLARSQRKAHRAMIRSMKTERYGLLLDAWPAFLDAPLPDPPPSPEAERPIREVAARRTWRLYRRVLKDGSALGPASEPEAFHELRIDCKKLRYMMELFSSLYPARPLKRLIKVLKGLQNVLGEYQDFEVQQYKLQDFARQMMAEGKAPAETYTAMGRLEAHLEAGQHAARANFASAFSRFSHPDVHRRFVSLFHPKAS